ncbi:hypothetical protein BUALT_Bualt11G0125300 [Buddleja alternifolia]|uniref:RING-CH-type domain-containing protein n=1 Tax=Buddleja alternifolia TaxID=168488 RepID=A0AAV6X2K3_9LAMI|nr:hypothetical protein BUALT_Bualt11G0125300 [Buddleja alternifolia]
MANLETPHIDLECGRRRSSAVESEEEEGSVCFSDGSCNSQFYSTAGDGSYDDYSSEINLENNGDLRDDSSQLSDYCRICHLSLVSSSPGCGVAIELGCCCKDDLAAAHKHCAETWFKIKGNKTCEICNSLARNVVGPNDIEAVQQGNEGSIVASTTSSAPAAASNTETRSCLNGHRFLNFLLACMVFAFVISWLFHFNIPS